MPKSIKKQLREKLGLHAQMPISFYVLDFIFRRLLRHNADTPWPVHHTSTIRHPRAIVRGIDVFPGDSPGVYINADNGIEIGDYTNIGPGVALISANHDVVFNDVRVASPPIRIGHHSWLGYNATVLPGVELGPYTIVGAGAIVTRSFPDGYCVLAGNPARVLRLLDPSNLNEHPGI
jgi:acetyltransferase-like isoleucine patch superfamily enzyme